MKVSSTYSRAAKKTTADEHRCPTNTAERSSMLNVVRFTAEEDPGFNVGGAGHEPARVSFC